MKDNFTRFLWRRRTAVFSIGPLLLLLVAKPTITSLMIGLPFIVVGQMIRFWAAGHLRKNSQVVSSGPFGYVRNPLYVGSFFIFTGLCVMINRWMYVPLLLCIFIIFHLGAIIYEEKHLAEVFGDSFNDYCKRVPRFIPRLRSAGGSGSFSFNLALTNREHKSALGTLVLVVLFVLRAVFISTGIHAIVGKVINVVSAVIGKA